MKNDNDNFLIALAFSIALHLLAIYFFLFGLPSIFLPIASDEQIITFDVLPVTEVSNIPIQKAQKDNSIENNDAKKIVASKVDEPVKNEKPKEEEKIEPSREAEIVDSKKKESEQKPEEKPKKEDKKPKDNKKKPKNTDLDSLLKNLEKESEGTNTKSTKRSSSTGEAKHDTKGNFNENNPLSISEKALIKQQIMKYWNKPIGGENIDQIKIIVYISLNQDGSVLEVKVKDKICGSASAAICQVVADSSIRALWQASPLQNLPIERYDTWREFNFVFDMEE